MMKEVIYNQIQFHGITMQIPENWKYKTEVFKDEDGTESYGLSINARGRDARNINLSWGIRPEGTNAYTEACITYEQVVGEEDLTKNDEPIMSFEFQKEEAHGFNVVSEDSLPCFFFCVDYPRNGKNILLTVLTCAANVKDLEHLIDFVEENLIVE